MIFWSRLIPARIEQDQKQDQNWEKKRPDSRNLVFFVPNFVVARLGVEPRTY